MALLGQDGGKGEEEAGSKRSGSNPARAVGRQAAAAGRKWMDVRGTDKEESPGLGDLSGGRGVEGEERGRA